jgi:polyhydroxyalkanoate synthesis repressor PhaR
MSEPRVIKKYPNRRLYDTVQSKYITLSDIRSLVLERIEFVVIDKKSQDDITRSILLQVIAEQEHGVDPVMSRDFLSQVIRSYGGNLQNMLSSYLEQSMKLFGSQQRELREKVKAVVGMDPVETVAGVAQRNYQRWRSVQDEIFKTLMNATGRTGVTAKTSPPTRRATSSDPANNTTLRPFATRGDSLNALHPIAWHFARNVTTRSWSTPF